MTQNQHLHNIERAQLEWKEEQERRKQEVTANKRVILDALRTAGFPGAVALYDGGGDSGQMDDINPLAPGNDPQDYDTHPGVIPDDETADWPEEMRVTITRNGAPENMLLKDATLNMAWDFLESCHPGWENNDGGQGTVVFDVAQDKISLNHTQYYTESSDYVDEV